MSNSSDKEKSGRSKTRTRLHTFRTAMVMASIFVVGLLLVNFTNADSSSDDSTATWKPDYESLSSRDWISNDIELKIGRTATGLTAVVSHRGQPGKRISKVVVGDNYVDVGASRLMAVKEGKDLLWLDGEIDGVRVSLWQRETFSETYDDTLYLQALESSGTEPK